ncbi:hypothetical protein DFH08DRAFT_935472 [Mycena albidolilacea]|uniref:Uncharacterized protein n=1 Tax=Mycena albidolilacea TaxID=1033008 RepID=A0AAD7EV02_9AGAR|nr:hypothetical protein DFH08DRAFT_935472 [Mycena albidolilacea]
MPNPTGSTSQKRPFQDITDRFISPRPTRKPKIPGGAFGEKVRLRVTEANSVFPSSLPPSSPPLYQSSSSRQLSSEDAVAKEIHEEPFGHEDFGSMLPSDEEGDPDAENRAPAQLSDPFGFFAVERKLKAERQMQPPPLPAALRASRYTDDKERDDGLVMPATPHKPSIGKRGLSDVSPASARFSNTPSPVKAVGGRHSDTMNTSHELLPIQPEDDDAPRRSKRARRSSSDSEPLPPLPLRRSTRGQSKAVVEKEPSKPKKQVVRKAPAKTKGKGKGKKKAAVEDNDLEDQEEARFFIKLEAERQARLEYFRKLDDYSFEKENVYVV